MCGTCGCSDENSVTIRKPGEENNLHKHSHVHAGGTTHVHDHDHDGSHGHSENHDHSHEHGHSHVHADGSVHEHDHDHDGSHGHSESHDHSHEHKHSHVHADGTTHEHDHDHDENHGHSENHDHSHDHGHTNSHNHDHDHDGSHGHSESHDHSHEHKHSHVHADGTTHVHDHDHDGNHGHSENHDHSHDHGHTHSHNHDHGNSYEHSHAIEIKIEQDILRKNDLLAERNRGYFEAKNILSINLVSSPGSGKTSLLERTIKEKKTEFDFFIVEGDQQTMNDAERILAAGAPAIQINTGQGCHLDADMVNRAVKALEVKENSVLFIENVGNLVCPAMFDLGESKRVVVISVTEGEDKPIKYPAMFATSNICIINKIDLLPYLDFDVEKLKNYAKQVNHHLEFIEVSVKSGEGMDKWYQWLRNNLSK